jgi:repressor LexA
MYPRIAEGDLALVHRQTSVDSGSLAVVLVDHEEAVVKKVYYGADWIELLSINPAYPPRKFCGADVQRVFVIGKVISVLQTWE